MILRYHFVEALLTKFIKFIMSLSKIISLNQFSNYLFFSCTFTSSNYALNSKSSILIRRIAAMGNNSFLYLSGQLHSPPTFNHMYYNGKDALTKKQI